VLHDINPKTRSAWRFQHGLRKFSKMKNEKWKMKYKIWNNQKKEYDKSISYFFAEY
jgi:hypothetical protein